MGARRTGNRDHHDGGDEFVVLLPELESPGSALAAARKIRARLSVPYVIDGTEIAVTASIGTALYPDDGHEYGELMRVTDGSMYRDKAESGRQRSGDAAEPIAASKAAMKAPPLDVPATKVNQIAR